jgi:2-desacetyl-2-hydroxyethyl bacteriochlorophyllide A dehydrogenase
MKNLICTQPHHFEYSESGMPVTGKGEVLLKVTHVGICGTDLHAFEGIQPYFSYPRILGHELAAQIEDPCDVEGFTIGESVTLIPYFSCGHCIACKNGKTNCCSSMNVLGVHSDGAMREWISVPASALVRSGGLSGEQLALTEPLAIGAHGIRRAGVRENEWVLVVGAGPIGLGTMAFAKMAGARVIAMDISEERLNFAKHAVGVNAIVNPSMEDSIKKILDLTSGDMPDVVIDATGNLQAINQSFKYLSHGGRYVLIGLQKGEIVFSHPEFHKREATLMSSRNATRQDFDQVISSIREKKFDPLSFITHRVSFDEVKEAFPFWLDPKNKVIKAMVIM